MEKKNIEDLSNLVFGLALTLGAVTLVRPDSNDFIQLFGILLNFALGFFIIVWIWWLYNRRTKGLDMDRKSEVILNCILLFLVVIEPYLWTLTTTSSGATMYALDLGTALLILATFSHFTIQKARKRGENVKRKTFERNASYFFAMVFYASIIPGLMPEFQPYGVQGLIWLSVLVIAVLSRFRSDKNN